ncbi:MAG: polysaccharide deacetylase family protein [Alphaproteobacteria bacterium]|jgi:peptidoglycan/xylan/chitin deacetylase (PgdA/CDA1 family)|nr:polysaccharide deacetylase family protein [Alphaproteobacteria bacterium]MDP6515873.1 polysaccharide deacetylase family protein [Alphaproteobacteria bacterium]
MAAGLAVIVAVLVELGAFSGAARAQDSAVVLMYHGFGAEAGPTGTDIADFEAHIAHLADGDYSVLPLGQVVAALQTGTTLPNRSITITIDSAHVSVYREAWPRLKAAGFPFTVFVATDSIDSGRPGTLGWDRVRELASAGVTIGSQGAAYRHLATLSTMAAAADIERAHLRLIEELGVGPAMFAYPYGEYGATVQKVLAGQGYAAALGQHSGVLSRSTDPLAVPRFSLTGRFAKIGRFRLVVDTLPLPVSDLVPPDPVLGVNPPALGFTVADGIGPLDDLACYTGRSGRLPLEKLGPSRIEVRFAEPLPVGRSRVNCTLPGPDGRWRWFGLQFLVPAE